MAATPCTTLVVRGTPNEPPRSIRSLAHIFTHVPSTPSTFATFAGLADASSRLAATRSRLEKRRILVDLLRGVPVGERAPAVAWLAGAPAAEAVGVGPIHLWRLTRGAPAAAPSLTVAEVDAALRDAAAGARGEAVARIAAVVERLTEEERAFFVGALTGSLRQGSLGGVMILALAELAGRTEAEVRGLVQRVGSVAEAARALLDGASEGIDDALAAGLEIFRPLAPMLAAPAESVEEAIEGIADPVVEWKIDGVRAQVHKRGDRVVVFSRQGHDITAGCGALRDALAALRAETAVLDGEIALMGADGKARPFQDSFSTIASGAAPVEARAGDRLRVFLFDCIHRDGVDLLDAPLSARLEALEAIAPTELIVPRARTRDPGEARRFYDGALAAGHEGVVVKDLASPYALGARGRAWQKVKEHTTVDLVVLAVEWGSGRRKGWLSNLHLGARRPDGTFCMVGKTFKGLTDAMLAWQTARLLELETSRDAHTVHVRPELVVEIRFNDVQRSPRYPGGIALRFARVVRHRDDKAASETEPLEALIARLPEGSPPPRTPRKSKDSRAAESAPSKQLRLFG